MKILNVIDSFVGNTVLKLTTDFRAVTVGTQFAMIWIVVFGNAQSETISIWPCSKYAC